MAEERPTIDFVVEKPGEGVQLLVEAKNTTAPSREWASRFLRNLFVHAQMPESEYFLLALRDHLYLWKRPAADAREPDFEGDTATALQPYLLRLQGSLDTMTESSFELLIQAWLNDLIAGTSPEGANLRWLQDSGLSESIRDAAIKSNLAA